MFFKLTLNYGSMKQYEGKISRFRVNKVIPLHRLQLLEEELTATVSVNGAYVENKGLLVAWHYRYVNKFHKRLRE